MNESTVRVTREGWWIQGKRRILLCASLFYFRIPKELWADRMERLAQSGYHALDVYIPWNFHEPERGVYLFDGQRDVQEFLRLARDAGLYVIARPGPYICSEWDGGALPAWLYPDLSHPETDPRSQTTFHSGHKALRQADPRFLNEVSRWYDAVLPILREEQLDAGGAVLAVQIDNELDFYPCADPKAYLSFLKESVQKHAITVPILACSGEDGVSKATGDLQGVVPTANIYSRYRAPGLEERVRRVRDQLLERNAPLTITETDRNHFTLRRHLSVGAHFLGPYLQVSGHHTGYFAGQNNWGKPSTFLQNDYDFGGMIGPDGELREEFYEARILSGMIAALESELVDATPMTIPVEVMVKESGATRRHIASALSFPSGARLLFLPNLDDETLQVVEPIQATVPTHRVAILASDIDLARFGVPFTLKATNAEIARVVPTDHGCVIIMACEENGDAEAILEADPEASVAPAWGPVRATDLQEGSSLATPLAKRKVDGSDATGGLETGGERPHDKRKLWRVVAPFGEPESDELMAAAVQAGDARLVLVFAPRRLAARAWEVTAATSEHHATAVLEIGWDWVSRDGSTTLLYQPRDIYRVMTDGTLSRVAKENLKQYVSQPSLPATTASGYRRVNKPAPIGLLTKTPADRAWQGDPQYLESLGVHYGAAYYRFTVNIHEPGESADNNLGSGLWIGGASDAVSFYINGSYLGTALPRGRSVWLVGQLPWRTGENEVVVRTEIMGHSNFHDPTVPVTHLGSMRGLAPPVVVSDKSPGADEYAEHLETASMPSRDPAFIYGVPQPTGRVVDAPWQLWQAAIVEEATTGVLDAPRPFPLELKGGEIAEVQVELPKNLNGSLPFWVRLLGRGVKGELWLSHRLVGRFWLHDHPDLLFTGGRWLDRIWLPQAWLGEGPLTIRLLGVDRERGHLEGIKWLQASGGRESVVQ